MRLEGIHHLTAITADAQRNLDFYVGTLGLRFVKKTVNFDAPDVYHLYYGDERGAPGSIMTFFEFPDAARGRHGAGMIHTLLWRVASPAAIDFWAERLDQAGVPAGRTASGGLRFEDPEGLGIELVVADVPDAPLVADARDIPAEHALRGFHGARAYAREADRSTPLLEALGFEPTRGEWTLAGDDRRAVWAYDDEPPAKVGLQGAGTVHHIAWATRDEDQPAWQQRAAEAGARVTPIIDRQYFESIYLREPSGVLFEIATLSPGFDADEPLESLGEELKLPPQHERLRPQLERVLTPLVSPRTVPSRG